MTDTAAALTALAAADEVARGSDAVREACTRLRWHRALRRRTPEAAAESRVRGAWASAELEGARSSVDVVRDLARGARPRSPEPDPAERVLHGVLAATAETEHVRSVVARSPMQALARLHVAAAAGLVPDDQLGRPRRAGEEVSELTGLGPPPAADEVAERLRGLAEVVRALEEGVPALLVAAVVHAEVATLRPFTRGNGAVARATERALLAASGLDPTGVAVPESGHRAAGAHGYVGALAAYTGAGRRGVLLWVGHCAEALRAGAEEGERVADAVLVGRLAGPDAGGAG